MRSPLPRVARARLGWRRSLTGAAVAVAGAAALGAGVGLEIAAGRGGDVSVDRRGPPVRAAAALESAQALFGDEVAARLEVIVDTTRVPLRSVRIATRFTPYRVGTVETADERLGHGFTRRVSVFRLHCLEGSCVPGGERRTFRFAPARIEGSGAAVTATWPPLAVATRLAPGARYRLDDLVALPVPGHGPGGGTLLWLAVPSAVAGLLLIGLGLRRPRTVPAAQGRDEAGRRDPVSTAARAVRERLAGNVLGRERGSLDRLACALEETGRPALAHRARALAWRARLPADDEVEGLLNEIERLQGGAAAEPPPPPAGSAGTA